MISTLQEDHSTQTPDLTLELTRLRSPKLDWVLISALIMWMLYAVSGFRSPFQAITISDANASASIRQLVFASAGMIALFRLLSSRTLATLLCHRWPLTLLGAYLAFSCLWSEAPTLTIKRSAIFAFGLLALLTIVHSTAKPTALMLRTIIYFGGAVSLLSIAFHAALPEACTVNPARPGLAGISNHPNTLAPFVSISLILSLGYSASSKREARLILLTQCVLSLALILTSSITTWATTLVGIALYLYLSSNHYRRGILQLAVAIAIAVIVIAGFQNVKREIFDAAGRDESLSGRGDLWKIVFYEGRKKPIIGHGFGAFWTEGKGRELVQTWNPRQSHHTYLDTFLDLGIVGLLGVLVLFPIRLLVSWPIVSGNPRTPRRRASAALMAVAFSYLGSYAFSQSFLLRFDAYPFFVLVWSTLLLTNTDRNRMNVEFA